MTSSTLPLIEADALSKTFPAKGVFRRGRPVQAVRQIHARVARGEALGVVGESGSGKSTLGRMMLGLLPATSGSLRFDGKEMEGISRAEWRRLRRRMQIVFQDPFSSLDPRRRIGPQIADGMDIHGLASGAEQAQRVGELLARVGLDPAHAQRFPHEFSGGQRQRIGIARALAVQPEFLVCDESVAALDVSIQAQVLNLFMRLRQELDLTYLFISHDLGVVEHLSDRVVIMYLGRVVEEAPAEEVFARANHPYTQSLLAAVPRIEARKKSFAVVQGEIPSPLNPPKGCHFHPRCPHAFDRCRLEVPVLKEIAPGHRSRCHLNDLPAA